MENASKALIIAGAILISILLIAISMYIYNSAQGTINNAADKMSEQEKSVYNSAVSSYIGTNKKGVDVKSLIDAVIASNNNNVGAAGKCIAIKVVGFTSTVPDSLYTNVADTTLGVAGDTNNVDATVNGYSTNMSALKSYVNMGKRYNIVATYSSGLVTLVTVTEVNPAG